MASPKRKVIDTATTNPAEFLAGGPAAEAAPVQPEPAPPANPPAPTPGTIQSVTTVAQSAGPVPAAPTVANEGSPPPVEIVPDPFVVIAAWNNETSRSTLRAFGVPGGCLVRSTQQFTNGALLQSVCFVPAVKIGNGALIAL